ncbi:MAG: sortase domain-containing protein, partial [Culicoidibacterales bacterium]
MKALKRFFREHGTLAKKLSMTVVIPLMLAVAGGLIISASAWNFIAQAYLVGSTVFNRQTVQLDARTYNINGQEIIRPQLGEQFATLSIPAVELERPIIHGDGPAELRRGVGHFSGSTLPGESGNVILDGHRDTMLFPLKDI